MGWLVKKVFCIELDQSVKGYCFQVQCLEKPLTSLSNVDMIMSLYWRLRLVDGKNCEIAIHKLDKLNPESVFYLVKGDNQVDFYDKCPQRVYNLIRYDPFEVYITVGECVTNPMEARIKNP
jgi:hypothetical protein